MGPAVSMVLSGKTRVFFVVTSRFHENVDGMCVFRNNYMLPLVSLP